MQHPRSGRQSEVRRPLTVPGSEFWNRLSFTENWNWSTCAVSDFDSIGVYSQMSINRRQEVPYANSSFGCVLSMTIRGADNLTSGDATPAEQARICFSELITRIWPARLEPRNQLFIKPALEMLETRLAPSISIQLDYSHDASGFFTNHPERESLLSTAANALASRLGVSLSAIVPHPTAGDTWNAVFSDPSSGTQTQIGNLTVAANTIIIFVGGQLLGGGEGGFGGPGGFNASGDQAWLNIVEGRGKPGALGSAAQQTAFAPWGAP